MIYKSIKSYSTQTLLTFILTLFYFFGYSQTSPDLVKIIPPSPNVAALQQYGDIPVSAYTGNPNISIPIYTVQSNDITIPLSISYHAGGIKVAEDASEVGLGWVLNAGGVISRNIIGKDDFTDNLYFDTTIENFSDGQGPISMIQEGCKLDMFNKTIPNLPTLYSLDLTNYLETDRPSEFQPDQYFYNFLGQSGKFILKRNKQAVIENQDQLDITLTTTSSITNNSWEVKSADGYIYDFTVYETSSTVANPGDLHNTAWYLTRITSPKGNTVTFNYSQSNQLVTTIGAYEESVDAQELPVTVANNVCYSTSFGTQKGMAPAKTYTQTLLSSIDFSNGQVKFNYSNNRLDLPGDERLDSISIYQKNSAGTVSSIPLKTFAFIYDYFSAGDFDNDYSPSNVGHDANYKRLKLTEMIEKGYYDQNTVSLPPYVFTYFEGSTNNLPSKASFARDHWGYYNGRTSNTSLIPSIIHVNSSDYITYILGAQGNERDPDPAYTKAYTLSSIKYPTGGSTDFDYESNDFDEEKSMVNDHSSYQAKTLVSKSETLVYDNDTKTLNVDTLNLSDEYIDYNPIQDASLFTHLQAAFRFTNTALCSPGSTGMLTFDIYDLNGNDLISKDYQYFNQCNNGNTNSCLMCSGGSVSTYNTDLNLPPGKYVLKVHCDNSLVTLTDIHFTFSYYTTVTVPPNEQSPADLKYGYGGGLRIKRIINHDGINPEDDQVTKYVYHYFEDRNNDGTMEEYSYGRRMCKPVYNSFEWSDEQSVTHAGSKTISLDYMAPHFMRNSDSNVPLNGSAGGAVVGYDHVSILYGENGENGKSEYTYVNEPDNVSSYIIAGNLPSRPPFSASLPNPLNGSLVQEDDYKNIGGNFQLVKSVKNSYSLESKINARNENRVYGMEVRTPVLFEYYDGQAQGTGSLLPCSSYLLSYTILQSEWSHLDKTEEKDYNQNDPSRYIETETKYSYNNNNHLPNKIVRTNSKNETITSTVTYPLDYTTVTGTDALSLGIKELQNSHMYNSPVESYKSISNADGTNSRVVGATLSSYQSNKPFPSIVYSSILSSPSTSFAPAATTSGGSTKDISYQPLLDFDSYDASGNILQQHKQNDLDHAYVWDYHSSLPIAEVKNASSSNVAYTSFESDGKGNWIFSGSPSTAGGAITGTRSYGLSSGAISKSNLTSGIKYIVSYWSKGSVSVSGGTQTNSLSGKAVNGWTYHEVTVSGTTTINISGSGYIDELRLYPSDAQMTTYTYEPLVGITTKGSVDGTVEFYEYDGLGQLQDIRDENGDIIKTFEYHYKQ